MEAAYNFLTGPSLIICFIAFILVSYILLGLLTWSYIKPLKYIGIPALITGVITLSLKGAVSLTVNYIAKEELELFKPFLDECGNLFVIFALIFIISGIILITLYALINYFQNKHIKDGKSKREEQPEVVKPKTEEASLKQSKNKVKKEKNLL